MGGRRRAGDPRLRVHIMHAGYPLLEHRLALLFTHPQVYVQPSMAIDVETRSAFYRFPRGIDEIARHHGR